jgi:hypothetical protein
MKYRYQKGLKYCVKLLFYNQFCYGILLDKLLYLQAASTRQNGR